MVRVYGVKVSNLPHNTSSSALIKFFQTNYSYPIEIVPHWTRVANSNAYRRTRSVCVHFPNESARHHAVRWANGRWFMNRIINVERCACTRSMDEKGRNHQLKPPPKRRFSTSHIVRTRSPSSHFVYNHTPYWQSPKYHAPRALRTAPANNPRAVSCRYPSCRCEKRSCAKPKCVPLLCTCSTLCNTSGAVCTVHPLKQMPRNKIHGVKVSKFAATTTQQQLREHFESRGFPVTELCLYTHNKRDYFACIHLDSAHRKTCAINTLHGSKLYGCTITVQSCCCTRSLSEKGYAVNSTTSCSSRVPPSYDVLLDENTAKVTVLNHTRPVSPPCDCPKHSAADLSPRCKPKQYCDVQECTPPSPPIGDTPASEAPTVIPPSLHPRNSTPDPLAKCESKQTSEAPSTVPATPSTLDTLRSEAQTVIPPSVYPDRDNTASPPQCQPLPLSEAPPSAPVAPSVVDTAKSEPNTLALPSPHPTVEIPRSEAPALNTAPPSAVQVPYCSVPKPPPPSTLPVSVAKKSNPHAPTFQCASIPNTLANSELPSSYVPPHDCDNSTTHSSSIFAQASLSTQPTEPTTVAPPSLLPDSKPKLCPPRPLSLVSVAPSVVPPSSVPAPPNACRRPRKSLSKSQVCTIWPHVPIRNSYTTPRRVANPDVQRKP